MELAEIPESDRAQHLDLLLIADESADMIERYLHRGDLLALIEDDEARALCVVTQEEPDVFEIKNIVTVPERRRKGYGGGWSRYAGAATGGAGTGSSSARATCPASCASTAVRVRASHVVENFFVDNYDHPMYKEPAHKLIDMVYLKMPLANRFVVQLGGNVGGLELHDDGARQVRT